MFQRMGQPMFFAFQDVEEVEPQSRGVSDDFLEKLPPMEEGKEADCNICLEKVGSNGNKSCQLPCGHAFDKSCLSHWLKEHDSCPCCRTKLDTDRPQAQNAQTDRQQPRMMPIESIPFQGFPFGQSPFQGFPHG